MTMLTNHEIAAIERAIHKEVIKNAKKGILPETLESVDLTIHIQGAVKKGKHKTSKPTSNTKWKAVLALLLKGSGAHREADARNILNALQQAMALNKDAEKELLKDSAVADAFRMLDEEVFDKLPRKHVEGTVSVAVEVQVVDSAVIRGEITIPAEEGTDGIAETDGGREVAQ